MFFAQKSHSQPIRLVTLCRRIIVGRCFLMARRIWIAAYIFAIVAPKETFCTRRYRLRDMCSQTIWQECHISVNTVCTLYIYVSIPPSCVAKSDIHTTVCFCWGVERKEENFFDRTRSVYFLAIARAFSCCMCRCACVCFWRQCCIHAYNLSASVAPVYENISCCGEINGISHPCLHPITGTPCCKDSSADKPNVSRKREGISVYCAWDNNSSIRFLSTRP